MRFMVTNTGGTDMLPGRLAEYEFDARADVVGRDDECCRTLHFPSKFISRRRRAIIFGEDPPFLTLVSVRGTQTPGELTQPEKKPTTFHPSASPARDPTGRARSYLRAIMLSGIPDRDQARCGWVQEQVVKKGDREAPGT